MRCANPPARLTLGSRRLQPQTVPALGFAHDRGASFTGRGAPKRPKMAASERDIRSIPNLDPASLRGHLPALDGLRGVAVLLVLGFHFLHLDGREELPFDRAVLAAAGAGWCGVDLFFVLSGFLITGILLDAKGSEGWLSTFWTRRALRIFPLHYAYLAALFLVAPWLLPAAGLAVPATTQAWFWTYSGNVLFALRGTFDGAPSFTAHLWSLAVEEQFYLVWPLVVALLTRRGVAWACLTAIAGAAALRFALLSHGPELANAAYVLMPSRMDALAIGGLAATLARALVTSSSTVRSVPG